MNEAKKMKEDNYYIKNNINPLVVAVGSVLILIWMVIWFSCGAGIFIINLLFA